MTKNAQKHKDEKVTFSVLITPHRSLSPRGFVTLMSIVILIAFVSGMVFLLHGAWPVFGFFGLDVALLYWAFKKNYRDGMIYEQIIYSREKIIVEREKMGCKKQVWDFHPTWLRIECEKMELGAGPLLMSSHGKQLEIAAFLGAEEKLELADRLQEELGAIKSPAFSS